MNSKYIIVVIILSICSIGSGQVDCLGPLNLSIDGSETGMPLTLHYIQSNIYCKGVDGGAIDVTISGGTPGYQCLWSTGDTLDNIFHLNPGEYVLTVTDAGRCSQILEVQIDEVTPQLANVVLAMDQGCGNCTLSDSTETFLFLGADFMVEVEDLYDLQDLGEIEVCLSFEENHMYFNERPLLKRSWTFSSTDNKASLKLFFNEDEITDLMAKAGYDEIIELVPSKLSILKFDGGRNHPDDYETVQTQYNVQLHTYPYQQGIYYIDVPNILFEKDKHSSLYLELVPTGIVSSTEEIEQNLDLDFYLFQNPVETEIQLRTDIEQHKGTGQIVIYNKLGQKLQSRPFNKENLDGIKFNVMDLTPGLYFITINYNDRKFTQTLKFVKV